MCYIPLNTFWVVQFFLYDFGWLAATLVTTDRFTSSRIMSTRRWIEKFFGSWKQVTRVTSKAVTKVRRKLIFETDFRKYKKYKKVGKSTHLWNHSKRTEEDSILRTWIVVNGGKSTGITGEGNQTNHETWHQINNITHSRRPHAPYKMDNSASISSHDGRSSDISPRAPYNIDNSASICSHDGTFLRHQSPCTLQHRQLCINFQIRRTFLRHQSPCTLKHRQLWINFQPRWTFLRHQSPCTLHHRQLWINFHHFDHLQDPYETAPNSLQWERRGNSRNNKSTILVQIC